MAYTGQHYAKANLVNPTTLEDTGFIDPRTVNWLYELFAQEAGRLTTGLFGAGTLARFHFVTDPVFPAGAKTPCLLGRLSDVRDSEVGRLPPAATIAQKYGTESPQVKTFTLQNPQPFDVLVEWIVGYRDEHPPFDLEQKLLNLALDAALVLCGEEVPYYRDTPTYKWEATEAKANALACVVCYRNVPLVWGTHVSWGQVIQNVSLAIYDKLKYDEFGALERLDGTP
jgi:hypothetical protein